MADEDITLDGKPLQSLRVADLKAALEQRNLPKSGQKNALIKRLKGALMLENLQKSSSSHIGLQPNSQIGEEMSQNSFIKQYLAKQQELLRQRLEREAQQAAEADESPAVPEEDEDHSEDNDSSSYVSDKHRAMPSQPPLTRAEEEGGGGPLVGQGMTARRPDMGPGPTHHHQEYSEAPGAWLQRATIQPGHEEPPTPSPPRAVASLSVRVLGQPDRQGLPPAVPRAQEKEGTAPAEPGSAHPVLHLSRSAGAAAAARIRDDSDDDDDDDGDDESEEDEEWGPGPAGARRGGRAPPQLQQPSPSIPSAAARSRRKLQPPQHIPPPQVHQPPMQLRHPTPPPSPPPELSFPLPDTPKQSPPDTDEPEGEGPRAASYPHPSMQREDSDSSSSSSSPEPPQQRRPGPLSLLARKMESEGAFPAAKAPLGGGMSGETASSSALHAISAAAASSNESPLQRMERERQQEKKEEEDRRLREEKENERRQEEEREGRRKQEEERERKRLEEEKERERKRLEEEKERERKQLEEKKRRQEEEREQERKRQEEEKRREEKRLEEERDKRREAEEKGRESRLPPWKRGQDSVSQSQAGSEGSAMEQGAALSLQHSKRSVLVRDASPQKPLFSVSVSSAAATAPAAKRPRVFSDTPAGPVGPGRGSVVVTEAQDSGSSSDSDSKSDSSSRSSPSSSSSSDKPRPARQLKKGDKGQEAEKKSTVDKGEERRYPAKREVSEPSAAAVTEVDPDSENSMSQQPSEAEPENSSESRPEESTTPKAFAARKISLTSSKTSPASTEGGAGESETGTAAGRKRRWGSSTAVTAKKPSISITTDSLKSLIPDIKVSQEAVVELHPEELQLSGDEENLDPSRGDQDKGLKIRRTVTQVVPGDSQENGQGNEEEEDAEKTEKDKQRRISKDKRKNSHSEEILETQTSVKHDAEAKKVTPSDSLVRRSISQQKSGVSITIDDPVRAAKQPSPPRGKVSNIIHVTNLVRPFTLGQLKELLNRTGSVVEEGFWIDKIKSHCYVTYATAEEAVATRAALHGVKWPQSNPKVLNVDFCEQDELDFHKGLLKPDRGEEDPVVQPGVPQTRLPPLMPERDRDRERDRERERDRGMAGVRDQWAEREREMERRERARGEREWDRDKIREFGRPGEDGRRSRSRDRERRRRERAKSKERRSDKKEKDEPPAKLLDDLFLKTKAAPCIYWLPLTEEQAAQRVLDRAERQKERERKRKEQQEEEDKKREEEKKERLKGREREGGATAGSGGAGRGGDGDRERERERDRERERGRERDGDKKRDGYRPRRPSGGAGGGRRSRSRSNPRDRRR